MAKEQTVAAHIASCKSVAEVIDNANALLGKCKAELETARAVMETLIEFQHPKLTVDLDYRLKDKMNCTALKPEDALRREIARINALLGDRA